MNVSLTPELEQFVRRKVESGLYTSASEVVREALRLLEEHDRDPARRRDRLRADIEEGMRDAREGRVIELDDAGLDDLVRRIVERSKKAS